MNPRKYANGEIAPVKPTMVAVKKNAVIAGAMAVMFCMSAPVSPSARTWSWVVASTSPGSPVDATFSLGGLVAIPAAPLRPGPFERLLKLRSFAQSEVLITVPQEPDADSPLQNVVGIRE